MGPLFEHKDLKMMRNYQNEVNLCSCGATDYCKWFWYSLCCQGCAMFSLGGRLGERVRAHYIVFGVMLTLATVITMGYQVVIDTDEQMSTEAKIFSSVGSLLWLIMLVLAIIQRVRFSRIAGDDENVCVSILASWCCIPCSYG